MESPDPSGNRKYRVFDPGGTIFKIVADPMRGQLALEVRDAEARQVKFAVVDLADGSCIYPGEWGSWWRGLSNLKFEFAVIHHFEDPSLPVHRGVEFIQLPEGNTLFKDSDGRVIGESEDGILLDTGNGAHLFWEGSGVFRGVKDDAYEDLLTKCQFFQRKVEGLIRNPEFGWSAEIGDILAPALDNVIGEGASLSLETATLAAWHTSNFQGTLDSHLACVDSGYVQWNLTMEKGLSHLNPEPFFVLGEYVIWLEGRMRLAWRKF